MYTTVQEACDYAVQKIVEQGGPSENAEGLCVYDNGEGRCCAVGWLIPEHLRSCVGAVTRLISMYGDEVPQIIRDHLEVFKTLQSFHDSKRRDLRQFKMFDLQDLGIDTSAPQWKQWVEMGL